MEASQSFRGETERVEIANAGINDVATARDTIGFAPYVHAVAQFLTHENTQGPLTLSIEGEWGMGKSSFMQQLKAALRSDGKRVGVVEFNAWRHENQEALWAAFAHHVVTALHAQSTLRDRWRSRARLMGSRVNWRRNGLRVAALGLALLVMIAVIVQLVPIVFGGSLASVVDATSAETTLEKILGATGLAGSILGSIIIAKKIFGDIDFSFAGELRRIVETPDYAGHSAFIEEFHEDFQKIVDAYLTDRKGIIFIDDLDRCAVPKAADLMQAISLMISESPKLIFILGLDREKVAAGLAVKYETLIPYLAAAHPGAGDIDAGLEFGYSFLEKFIQLPFRVPRATPAEIRRLVLEISGASQAAPAETPEERPDLVEIVEGSDAARVCDIVLMVAPIFDNNPRRIKQFLNAFRLQTHIASATGLFAAPVDGHAPLTLERLGKFVALTLRWPALHEDIRRAPALLEELQSSVIASLSAPAGSPPVLGPEAAEWLQRPRLCELLAHGITNELGLVDYALLDRFSLAGLDAAKLLAISAPVDRTGHSTMSRQTVDNVLGRPDSDAAEQSVKSAPGIKNDTASPSASSNMGGSVNSSTPT